MRTGYRSKKQLNQNHKQPAKDKRRVICPLTFNATEGRTATNYTVDWASTIELIEFDGSGAVTRREVGCWRSQAKNRAFEPEFKRALSRLKMEGLVTWEEDSYFFFDNEGVEAAMDYIDKVVRGELRAHARSWRGRFEAIAGVSIEELKCDYPHIYGSGSGVHSHDVDGRDSIVLVQDEPVAPELIQPGREVHSEVEVSIVKDDDGRLTVIGAPDEEGKEDWLDSEPPVEELLDIQREQEAPTKTT